MPWALSPGVEHNREQVTFAVQVFPHDTRSEPVRHLLAAAQQAERRRMPACSTSPS